MPPKAIFYNTSKLGQTHWQRPGLARPGQAWPGLPWPGWPGWPGALAADFFWSYFKLTLGPARGVYHTLRLHHAAGLRASWLTHHHKRLHYELLAPARALSLRTHQNKQDSSMTSNDELLFFMLGQVNQERGWDLPQALCATNRYNWQREHEPKILRY